MRAGPAALAALALAAPVAGCGGGEPRGATVLAASSLAGAFTALAPGARMSFAGSDRLAFQVEQGAPADVIATADPAILRRLAGRGLVGPPRVFARNRLVVVVPRANPAGVRAVGDLARPGVAVVVGDPGVPVGAYAREALRRLGIAGPVLANVVSEETDAAAVAAKVALGEADAGIVYRTDARPVAARVRVVPVPARAQPQIAYAAAVVTRPPVRPDGEAFLRRLTGPEGRAVLRRHGFAAP